MTFWKPNEIDFPKKKKNSNEVIIKKKGRGGRETEDGINHSGAFHRSYNRCINAFDNWYLAVKFVYLRRFFFLALEPFFLLFIQITCPGAQCICKFGVFIFIFIPFFTYFHLLDKRGLETGRYNGLERCCIPQL